MLPFRQRKAYNVECNEPQGIDKRVDDLCNEAKDKVCYTMNDVNMRSYFSNIGI